MNIITRTFDPKHIPDEKMRKTIAAFLCEHLENFGDPEDDITKAIDYATGKNPGPGGHILVALAEEQICGAVIINKTGMQGYIPENILVYIATHKEKRGQGIGKLLMLNAIKECEGDIALHVEPDNPAKKLYEHLGFTNKYLEMRLKK